MTRADTSLQSCRSGIRGAGIPLWISDSSAPRDPPDPAPTTDLSGGIGTLITVGGQTAKEDYYFGRFDYTLSPNDTMFVR